MDKTRKNQGKSIALTIFFQFAQPPPMFISHIQIYRMSYWTICVTNVNEKKLSQGYITDVWSIYTRYLFLWDIWFHEKKLPHFHYHIWWRITGHTNIRYLFTEPKILPSVNIHSLNHLYILVTQNRWILIYPQPVSYISILHNLASWFRVGTFHCNLRLYTMSVRWNTD